MKNYIIFKMYKNFQKPLEIFILFFSILKLLKNTFMLGQIKEIECIYIFTKPPITFSKKYFLR